MQRTITRATESSKLNLNIVSYPEFIYNFSRIKLELYWRSHGKTTITSMILHVLNDNNFSIDYVLGAQLQGLIIQFHFPHKMSLF